jgi:hypothetical protein
VTSGVRGLVSRAAQNVCRHRGAMFHVEPPMVAVDVARTDAAPEELAQLPRSEKRPGPTPHVGRPVLLPPRTLHLRLPDESRDAPIAARRQARIGIITVTKLRWVVGWPKTDSKFRRFFVMHRPAHLNRRNPGPPTACRWVHMPTPKPTTSEVPDANLRSKRASRSRVVRSRRPRWKCGAAEVAELAAAKLNRPERLPLAGTANRRRSGPRPARTWHQYFVEPRPRTSLGYGRTIRRSRSRPSSQNRRLRMLSSRARGPWVVTNSCSE